MNIKIQDGRQTDDDGNFGTKTFKNGQLQIHGFRIQNE